MSCVLHVESIFGLVLGLEGSEQLTCCGSVTGSALGGECALGGEWMATDDVRVFPFIVRSADVRSESCRWWPISLLRVGMFRGVM